MHRKLTTIAIRKLENIANTTKNPTIQLTIHKLSGYIARKSKEILFLQQLRLHDIHQRSLPPSDWCFLDPLKRECILDSLPENKFEQGTIHMTIKNTLDKIAATIFGDLDASSIMANQGGVLDLVDANNRSFELMIAGQLSIEEMKTFLAKISEMQESEEQ